MPTTTEQKAPGSELTPMKFSRLTRRGVLLGLSVAQLITLGIGGLTVLAAFYAGAGMLLAYTAPVWVLATVLTWVPIAGRPMVEWLPVSCWWLWRTTGGQLLYRRRIVKPRPAGNLALPGDMARLREHLDPDTGACMIHDPRQATLTVICEVTHPAFVLLDPGEQERRVDVAPCRDPAGDLGHIHGPVDVQGVDPGGDEVAQDGADPPAHVQQRGLRPILLEPLDQSPLARHAAPRASAPRPSNCRS